MRNFSTGEIAKLCDVNLRTVIRWIDRGVLKGFKLPGRGNNRVKEEDLVAFLQEQGMPIPALLQPTVVNKRILIVDDELPLARALQRLLRNAGYQTEIATDGFQAGSQIASYEPALMTLDLSMPGINGFEVLEFVRAQYPKIRVLVISALDERRLENALSAGADAVLSKPFENNILLEQIEALMDISCSKPY
ncbi:response regulator [Balneatrix alpica]|uniref:Response regulator n=1 Tax=Balneatrix alpica TaxID=75684 RepID=A0ABV5Z783_9GAMM|nr:response regulator [Balneatrix alpica]